MSNTQFSTAWDAGANILSTRLAGVLSPAHVAQWSQELEQIAGDIPSCEPFRMLVDIRGYEVDEQDREVHKLQREIIPTFLARRGFEVGFFRLLEVENTIAVDPLLARCSAVAHVHHDQRKMDGYNEKLGRDSERFFTDREQAEIWLRATG